MNKKLNHLLFNFFKQRVIIFIVLLMVWIPISSLYIDYIIWVRSSAALILLSMILVLIKMSKLNKRFLTLTTLFIIFLNIFHFGNVFIVMIKPDYNFMVLSFANQFSNVSNVVAAINFCVLTTFFFYLGLIYHGMRYKKETTFLSNYTFSSKQLKIYAILIIICSFPIQLYTDINKFLLAFSSGYLATYQLSISGVFIQIGAFYIIGFIILMIAYQNNYKSTLIYVFIMAYQAVNMFSGNRARQVLAMLIVSFIYFILLKKVSINKKNIKNFLLLLIPCYILMNCIINISSLRVNIAGDPLAFIQACFIPQKNVLMAILDEFGYTLYTVVLEMDRVTQFGKGLTYVGSLITVFPTMFPIQEEIAHFSYFAANLNYGGIGGTILGELYYNFSWIGSIFGIALGLFVNWFSNIFNSTFERKNYFFFSLLILPAITLLWWIRDSFLNIPRMVIYEVVFLFVLYYLSKYIFKTNRS